ncbi:uncharacterized protein [Paramisgurnus dabryanus]|uniref:uncharacterized protein n=1 Tax=Paramisgurnus dabryanus TaxID=90735 RepID=UPI0031F3EA86
MPKRFWFDSPERNELVKAPILNSTSKVSRKETAEARHSQEKKIMAAIQEKGKGDTDEVNEIHLLRQEVEEIKKHLFTEIPKLHHQLQEIKDTLHTLQQGRSSVDSLPSNSVDSNPSSLEEIHPETGVKVPRNVWRAANQANTGTAMARILLMGVFDIDTLMESNLRGGESKIVKGERRRALDEVKVKAIIDAVIMKHPRTTTGQIGTALNCKMAELRVAAAKTKC